MGIETSCDETSAAIVEDGAKVLSNAVATQMDIHKAYGGVVPEIAARSHIEVMIPVIEEAFEKANCESEDIDAIAVTYGPGLSGSLLIGTLTARTLATVMKKPLIPVNHVLGHVYANFLVEPQPEFPVLALIVSGGHTQLALFKDHFQYELLGQTRDDAVGEAFDKVARIIGLPYPGGPSIEKVVDLGDEDKYKFPIAKLDNPYDFSFSGPKTAVLRQVQDICDKGYDFPSFKLAELLNDQQRYDIAASFSKTAIETLVRATIAAYKEFQPKSVVIAGGVAASKGLREKLREDLPVDINYAPIALCTDNAAMIAALGFYMADQSVDPDKVEIEPSLSM